MKIISAHELKNKLNQNEDLQLIDVRETYEFEEENIGGENIPLSDVLANKERLAADKPVVFCCRTGKRSSAVTLTLERKFGMDNLYSLEGGVEGFLAQ